MVSIGKIYYKLEEYKTNSMGEPQFSGKLAGEMELAGKEATQDIYQNLRDGKDPETGEQLVKAGPNGDHRTGVDLCLSPDKSFSVAYATGNAEQRESLMTALNSAVEDTKNYIEKNLIQYRDAEGNSIKSGNMMSMETTHFTDRDNNLSIHTHLSIYNISKDAEGNYKAINSDALYQREHLIAVFEKNLAYNLQQHGIGVEGYKLESGNSIYTKIAGVSDAERNLLTTRSEQIDAWVKENKDKYPGMSRGELREVAALETRADKQETTVEKCLEKFEGKANEQGIDVGQTWENIKEANTEKGTEKFTEYEIVNIASKTLTESESTFSKQELVTLSSRLSQTNSEISFNKIQNAVTELTADKSLKSLTITSIKGKGEIEVMTTKEMYKIEKENVKNALDGIGKSTPAMSEKEAEKVITEKYNHYTQDQKDALSHMLTSKDRVSVVIGDAGTGKSTMLSGFREQMEAQGYQVVGLSKSAIAVQNLQEKSGIQSQTIDSFLLKNNPENAKAAPGYGDGYYVKGQNVIDQKINESLTGENGERSLDNKINTAVFGDKGQRDLDHQIDQKIEKIIDTITSKPTVYVIDEAGTISATECNQLSKAIGDRQVHLVGDNKQYSSICQGKPMHDMMEAGIKPAEMKETTRFTNEITEKVAESLAEGRTAEAFQTLKDNNKMHEIKDTQERLEAIVKDYFSTDKSTVILTNTNAERQQLNQMIREEKQERGEVSKEEFAFTIREAKNLNPSEKLHHQNYEKGEHTFVNKVGLEGMKLGAEGEIVNVNQKDNSLTISTKNGNEVNINLTRDGDKISTYKESEIKIAKGDHIMITKNDKGMGLINGENGPTKDIDPHGNISFKNQKGEVKSWNLNDSNYLTHSYAVTQYKSQGSDYDRAIINANTDKYNDAKSVYVSNTRGREDVQVYTNNAEKLQEQAGVTNEKASTHKHEEKDKEGEEKLEVKDEDKDRETSTKTEKNLNQNEDEKSKGSEEKDAGKDKDSEKESEGKDTEIETEIDNATDTEIDHDYNTDHDHDDHETEQKKEDSDTEIDHDTGKEI